MTKAKKQIKKEEPKQKKVVIPKIKKVVIPKYKLVSFGISATIPTQMYGNIVPEIIVKAKTIEEAKSIVTPFIEEMYNTYASEGPDGRKAKFGDKASVTVQERIVKPEDKKDVPSATVPSTSVPKASAPKTVADTSKKEESKNDEPEAPKSPAYVKAENAVKSAMSLDALNLIEDQIQKSVKLSDEEKPQLLTLVLKKRKEI